MDELGRLSDEEMGAVLRRASELEQRNGGPGPGSWDVHTIAEVAAEVGISPEAVHRAAAELQLATADDLLDLRAPNAEPVESVLAARVVRLEAADAERRLHEWLTGQGLVAVRRRPMASLWRPDTDRSPLHRTGVGRVSRQVAVVTAPVPGGTGTAVRIRVDLPAGRLRRAARHAATTGWTAAFVGWLGPQFVYDDPNVLLQVGVGTGWLVGTGVRSWFRTIGKAKQHRADAILQVEGFLDQLELAPRRPALDAE